MTKELPNLRPLFPWAGGKNQLAPVLSERMPKEYNNYFEPFVGGATMLFYTKPKSAVINDYNFDLTNLYEVVKLKPQELMDELKVMADNNNQEQFLSIRAWDREENFREIPNVKKAARMLYIMKAGYNGLYRVNKKGQINTPWGNSIRNKTKILDVDNIKAVSEFLNEHNITIMNGDYVKALETAKKGDFVYMDPPYIPVSPTANFTRYTKIGFNMEEQRRLVKTLDDLTARGVKVMVSNSNTDLTKELYANYNIYEINVTRNISSKGTTRGKTKELVITNY